MKYEKGAFITLPNVQKLRELTVGARATFEEICIFSDEYGKCFPSRKKIAENIQMHPNSVDRFIDELEQKGFISKAGRIRTDNSRTTNEYQILVIPLTTHSDTPLTTHSEAELNPILTKPTSCSAEAESEYVIVSDLEEEKRKPRANGETKKVKEVIALFDHPGKLAWIKWPKERESAVILYDTYGIEILKRRLARAKEAKEEDYLAPNADTPSNFLNNMPKLDRYFSV